MKVLLIAAVVVTALVAVVLLVGYALPKSHRASRKAVFHRAPEAIYAVIADPRWEPKGTEGIRYEIVENQPPRRLVRRIANTGLPFGGSWTFDLSSTNEGTVLRITEDGEIYNPVFRFVSRFFMGYTRTIDEYLDELGTKVGERVAPTD